MKLRIVPTKMGSYLLGLVFLLFILSIGYSNNLLLIFTLLVSGLALSWPIQTYFDVKSILPAQMRIEDGYAGEKVKVDLFWEKDIQRMLDLKVILKGSHLLIDGSSGEISVKERGLWKVEETFIESSGIYGLFKVRFKINLKTHFYIYPERKLFKNIKSEETRDHEGDFSSEGRGSGDFYSYTSYEGEDSRLINWKQYAKTGEIVTKEGEELKDKSIFIKLESNNEEYLKFVSSYISHLMASGIRVTFETLDGRKLHTYQEALRELAVC